MPPPPRLFAISDLHVDYRENRAFVDTIMPDNPGDWLIVAGDVSHRLDQLTLVLELLRDRFGKVIYTPGNHDLWTRSEEGGGLRGEHRYRRLVSICQELGVCCPEDPYPIWHQNGEDFVIAPLFLLYDYTLRPDGTTKQDAMARAYAASVVCADELLLFADPHSSREDWCEARVRVTRARLDVLPAGLRTVLISHWPLHPGPTRRLRHPEFAIWCGTRATEDWHLRYRCAVSIHGHLHIPLTDHYDGVRHEEVSLGYPRERHARTRPIQYGPRLVFPDGAA